MSLSFAIIGTRSPDLNQAMSAFKLANVLSGQGYVIRTGAAKGIDEQAMKGTQRGYLHVCLPWESYNSHIIPEGAVRLVYDPKVHKMWTQSVARFHPAVHRLSPSAVLLHARNYGIVDGVSGVFAFPDENGEGGTGQGIRIAKGLDIPLVQANRGTIHDVPVFISQALEIMGLGCLDVDLGTSSSV